MPYKHRWWFNEDGYRSYADGACLNQEKSMAMSLYCGLKFHLNLSVSINLGGATTVPQGSHDRGTHITVDLVWANASPRYQRWIDVFATLVLLFVTDERTPVAGFFDLPVTGGTATFEMLARGESVGVFQLESQGMRDTLRKMRCGSIEEITALISLYRPGPMDNIPAYIRRKHGQEPVTYLHPLLEPYLEKTYGIFVYQEDIMAAAIGLGGFTGPEADTLGYAIRKKKSSVLRAQKDKFVRQAAETGQLYGSVSTRDLAETMSAAGFKVERSQVALNQPIKSIGSAAGVASGDGVGMGSLSGAFGLGSLIGWPVAVVPLHSRRVDGP